MLDEVALRGECLVAFGTLEGPLACVDGHYVDPEVGEPLVCLFAKIAAVFGPLLVGLEMHFKMVSFVVLALAAGLRALVGLGEVLMQELVVLEVRFEFESAWATLTSKGP